MMRDERHEDKPLYSRVFVVCDKQMQQDELRSLFEKYGDVESVHMPRDRVTRESKGIAYIKFSKTSAAAAAIEGLHMKYMQKNNKPLKVIVATTKSEEKYDNEDKYKRLFIKVPKDTTENDIKADFSKFGQVDRVHLQKDRETNESRGFAYVHFKTFYEAALAYEECDKKYKPVFATPKEELKRSRVNLESHQYPSNDSIHKRDSRYDVDNHYRDINQSVVKKANILPLIKTAPEDYDTVIVSCSQFVPQKPVENLFNIIPGMYQFRYMSKSYGSWTATVKYDSKAAAAHAVAAINNYEFPSGEVLSVKPENTLSNVASSLSQIVNSFKSSIDSTSDLKHLADAIAQASTLLQAATSGIDTKKDSFKDNHCSVPLPPVKPRADLGAVVAQRCFLVFKPYPPPISVLNDVFCRFGDLIEINVVPNKTYGFAKFATAKSAQDAMNTLHNATVCGVHMKVIEAEEMKKNARDKMLVDNDDDDDNENNDRKRVKIDN